MKIDRHLFAFFRNADTGSGGGGGGAGGSAGQAAAAQGAAGGGSGGGGQSQQPWYGSHNFDADTVAWIEERKFPDLAETIKAGREGSKLARDRNVIERWDPKKLGEWKGWAEMGVTPEFDKYDIGRPQNTELFDDAEFNTFRRAAHELRIPPAMATALYSKMSDYGTKVYKDATTAEEAKGIAAENKLKNDWGVDYDANKEIARRAALVVFKDMPVERIDAVLGTAEVVRGMHRIGEMMGEDKLAGASASSGGIGGVETVAGLQAELNRLLADPDFKKAFNDPRHPQHQDMTLKRQNLMERKANAELRATRGKAA